MSGIEVVGVVLGVIPLVIAAAKQCEVRLQTSRRAQKRGIMMRKLATDLEVEEEIFSCTCTRLLNSIVCPDEIASLLADLRGPLWRDDKINGDIQRRLANSRQAFFKLVEEIEGSLQDLSVALEVHQGEKELAQNEPGITKEKLKAALKLANKFSDPDQKDSIMISVKRIGKCNTKLRELLEGNLNNENLRKFPSIGHLFHIFQDATTSIFNALRLSLSCSCAHLHGINFEIPIIHHFSQQQIEYIATERGFHLAIANRPNDSKRKGLESWLWNEILLRMKKCTERKADEPETGGDTPSCVSCVVKREGRASKLVRFASDLAMSSRNRPQLVPRNSSFKMAGHQEPERSFSIASSDSLRSNATSVASNRVFSSSNSTTMTSCATVTGTARSFAEPISGMKLNKPGDNGNDPSCSNKTRLLDLCHLFSEKNEHSAEGEVYGFVTDHAAPTPRDFQVSRVSHSLLSKDFDYITTLSLQDLFSRYTACSLPRKLHLAATIATSILTLHGTPWMPPVLTCNDLYLVECDGQIEWRKIFLTKRTADNDDDAAASGTKQASTTADTAPAVQPYPCPAPTGSDILHALGVILMELILWKPVHDFWDSAENAIPTNTDTNNNIGPDPHRPRQEQQNQPPTPQQLMDYSTERGARRAASALDRVRDKTGSAEYGDVARLCVAGGLTGFFAAESLADDPGYRDAVYHRVVAPLQRVAAVASRPMAVEGRGGGGVVYY